MHKYELWYIYPGHDVKPHPHRMKLYQIGFVRWLDNGECANEVICKFVFCLFIDNNTHYIVV